MASVFTALCTCGQDRRLWQEGWQSVPVGRYNAITTFRGDSGEWQVVDSIAGDPECGPNSPQVAEIVSTSGNKLLMLTSHNTFSFCVDNIFVQQLFSNAIPLTPETYLTFYQTGKFISPRPFSTNEPTVCIPPACGDKNYLGVGDNNGNVITYVLQYNPQSTPLRLSRYKEIFLGQNDERYIRNLFDDFRTFSNFNPYSSFIIGIELGINSEKNDFRSINAWAVFDDLKISAPRLEVHDANYRFTRMDLPLPGQFPSALDWLSQYSAPRVGACADGVTKVVLRYNVPSPGRVTFSVTNGLPGETLTRIDSYAAPLNVPVQRIRDDYYAFALYTVPPMLPEDRSNHVATFLASFTPTVGGRQIHLRPFQLFRPPVLLVHGVWAKAAETWTSFTPLLDQDSFHWHAMDYHPIKNAGGRFLDYRSMVWANAFATVRTQERSLIAATQVDVVAHSMGAILSRMDGTSYKLPANYRRGFIRRLITLDTPHWGARTATLLLEVNKLCPTIGDQMRRRGSPIDEGAVEDLDPRTFAASLRMLNPPGIHLSATPVPAHAIVGTVTSQADLPRSERAIYFASKFCGLTHQVATAQILCGQTVLWSDSEFDLANKVFTTSRADEHDAIVSQTSQKGGCSTYTANRGVAHTRVTRSAEVLGEVLKLLKGGPEMFSDSGFPAVSVADTLTQMCPPVASQTAAARENASPETNLVRIVSPQEGERVAPGSLVTVVVEPLPGVTAHDALVAVTSRKGLLALEVTNEVPFQLQVQAPQDALGTVTIDLMAADEQGGIDFETRQIAVMPPPDTFLLFLEANPNTVFLTRVGESLQLKAVGLFSDDEEYDVTDAGADTTYGSSDPSVATVSPAGLITAVNGGIASVFITNGLESAEVYVDVTLAAPFIISVQPSIIPSNSSVVNLVIDGLNLSGLTSVQFLRAEGPDDSLSLSNTIISASGGSLIGELHISPGAPLGPRFVLVTTPGSESENFPTEGNVIHVGSPPALTATRSNGNLVLSFPSWAQDFVLERTEDLTPPSYWAPVFPQNPPVFENGYITVTLSKTATQAFYQLRLPQAPVLLPE